MKKFLMLAIIFVGVSLNAQETRILKKCFLAPFLHVSKKDMVDPLVSWNEKRGPVTFRCTLIRATQTDYELAKKLLKKYKKLPLSYEEQLKGVKPLFGWAKKAGNIEQLKELRKQIDKLEDLIDNSKSLVGISRNNLGYKYHPGCHFFPKSDKPDGTGYIACSTSGATTTASPASPAMSACGVAGKQEGALGSYTNPETKETCYINRR